MPDAFVYAAARTPFGRFGDALAEARPEDLAAVAIQGVLAKAAGLDAARIEDVVWGCANQVGEDDRNVGRMAVLLAGLPLSVPVTSLNRLCGSSFDAAMAGSRTTETGDADVVLTGGLESMTRAPWAAGEFGFGIGWSEVAAVELNEALAAQSVACMDAWLSHGLADPEIVNTKGGAIAIGHPLGDRWGLAAICIGGGQALAVVLENVGVSVA